jgi:hypothetical protein
MEYFLIFSLCSDGARIEIQVFLDEESYSFWKHWKWSTKTSFIIVAVSANQGIERSSFRHPMKQVLPS